MSLRFGQQGGNFASGLMFAAQNAFISASDVFGTGALVAQSATVAGTGIRTVVDLGTPPEFAAGVVTVVGVGEVIHTGSGALQAGSATVAGVGSDATTVVGSGALQVQSASVSGVGLIGIGGVGVLLAGPASVSGTGLLTGRVLGTGALVASPASVVGSGARTAKGAGSLTSLEATIQGAGTVILFAVDYNTYLQPNTIALETLSMTASYEQLFIRDKKVPTSRVVDWDSLVTYHAGVKPPTEVAYEFSNDKKFVEDQD